MEEIEPRMSVMINKHRPYFLGVFDKSERKKVLYTTSTDALIHAFLSSHLTSVIRLVD